MPNIDPIAAFKLQPELLPGESIYWAGMLSPGKIFHADDIGQIPLSLMWGGFATFLLANVLGYINFGSKPSLPTVGVTYRDRIRHVSQLCMGDSTPVLADIPKADRVEHLTLDLREKSRVPA